jgi:AcrR family transcriptional regulator
MLTAALEVVVEQGWDGVTQANVASRAGYSRATAYAHWPDRLDLLRDAFAQRSATPHLPHVGEQRADLITELTSFRRAMSDGQLDRMLSILAERAQTTPEVIPIRDAFVAGGEGPLRQLVADLGTPTQQHVAVMMLSGLVTHSVLMHGELPTDRHIHAAVDIILSALSSKNSAPRAAKTRSTSSKTSKR